ncbi:MAG: hypothetical protein KAY32_01055 [Candidatus Eisenbacteria sp.]|nr:hypothetical protein [Candidatus Eisenbacteria bacterium]
MGNLMHGSRGFWISLGVLVLIGVFLGARSWGAVRAVLAIQQESSMNQATDEVPWTSHAAVISYKDSLLANVVVAQRDPFDNPPVEYRPRVEIDPEPLVREPLLRAILYDTVNPSVILSVGSASSRWLHEGESFLGWRVADIASTAVTVTHGDRSAVLSLSPF